MADDRQITDAATANANPQNWRWDDELRKEWTEAPEIWRTFATKWRSASEDDVSPESRVLNIAAPMLGSMNILIRDCYLDAENLVWRETVDPSSGAILTGQPGIGKTIFLWYLLIRLLHKQQVVLFYVTGIRPVLFYHDKVWTTDRISADTFPSPISESVLIWSLFDVNKEDTFPTAATVPVCFPVQTPPPSESLFKQWRKERGPLMACFPLWSFEELESCVRIAPFFSEFIAALGNVVEHWQDDPADGRFAGVFRYLRGAHGNDPPESVDQTLKILL